MIQTIHTEQDLDRLKHASRQGVLIFCWAAWCGSNRFNLPVFQAFAEQYVNMHPQVDIQFATLEMDDQEDLCQQLGVRDIPVVLHYVEGELRHQCVGVLDTNMLTAWIEQPLLKRAAFLEGAHLTAEEKARVQLIELRNQRGMVATFTNYGATWINLYVPDRQNVPVNVVLGYPHLVDYQTASCYLGATVGPIANRVRNGTVRVDDAIWQLTQNEGPNCLHSGEATVHQTIWNIDEQTEQKAVLSLKTQPGMGGYQAGLLIRLTIEYTDHQTLDLTYQVMTDQSAYVNMTQHAYFNLSREQTVLNHVLWLDADAYQGKDASNLATGDSVSVEGTPFDFNEPVKISEQLKRADMNGFDHSMHMRSSGLRSVAKAFAEDTGICMEMVTNQPYVQLYTGTYLPEARGQSDHDLKPSAGFCLEAQDAVDATQLEDYEHAILKAGEVYTHHTRYIFNTKV